MAIPEAALAAHIQKLREAKAAFQKLPEIVRDNMLGAIETTVREIARGAQARLQASPSIRTRALFNAVAWRVTKTSGKGRVGIAKTGTGPKNPARYAHLVEGGTIHMPAEPFMAPAAEAQKAPHIHRCAQAGKGIERDMAAIGGGRL